MVGGPFEPPAEDALVVVCNGRKGTLAIVGGELEFQPSGGAPERLPVHALIVVSCTHDGRVVVGLPTAILAFLILPALSAPAEVTVAVSVWIGVIAWGVGTQLFPAVSVDLEGGGLAWKVTSHDARLAPLGRALRHRMTTSSLRTTTTEMLTDSARSLVRPGDAFPWHRRAFAAWMLASIPGPTLLAVFVFAWASASIGRSGAVVFLGGLGLMVVFGPVALLPGLLLQFPVMWVLQRAGFVGTGVSSPPPEAG